jgi:ABC-2 type transport system ATP-binding protein
MSLPAPPFAVDIHGLSKRFDRPALLGPNGAGKTTTLRMLTGLLRPDSGSIAVYGIDALSQPVAAKRVTAWLSEEPMIYDKLTPFEYLEFVAGLWGIDAKAAEARANELLRWLGLAPHAHERCESFSRGMRQKVALAGALIHEPKLIVLDEPLTGLDAASARDVKAILRGCVEDGSTVIMTTHILEVAERMADRIGVIRGGKLIAEGTLEELRRRVGHSGASLEDTFLTIVAREPAT